MVDVYKPDAPRSAMQTVYENLPPREREGVRRAWEKGFEWHEVVLAPTYLPSDPLSGEASKPVEYHRYRFDLYHLFGPRRASAAPDRCPDARVDPIGALEWMTGRSRQCGKTFTAQVAQKALFNRLPITTQCEARRAYDEGNAAFVAVVPHIGRFAFTLRDVFSFPPGKPPAVPWALREDMEKTVADGVDALHLGGFGEAFKAKRAEVAAIERDLARQLDIQIGVDPAMGPDQAVMVSRDAQGRVLDAVRVSGFPKEVKGEFLDPTKPVQVFESNWPYDVAGTGFDVEPPNNTPRGLLMVAPMDYRLGQWRAR